MEIFRIFMEPRKNLILCICLLFLSGCASLNPFHQSYKNQTGSVDLPKIPTVIIPSEEPQVYSGSTVDTDYQKMLENNYELVVQSSFNLCDANKNKLVDEAKFSKVTVVILYSRYEDTISSTSLLTPITEIKTTTPLTKEINTPHSQDRYDCLATFWTKLKAPILGLRLQSLTTEQQQSYGTNRGAAVIAVINQSPAFSAGILRGDILRKLNNSEIIDDISFAKSVLTYAGQKVTLEILRNGVSISKQVQLDTPKE